MTLKRDKYLRPQEFLALKVMRRPQYPLPQCFGMVLQHTVRGWPCIIRGETYKTTERQERTKGRRQHCQRVMLPKNHW